MQCTKPLFYLTTLSLSVALAMPATAFADSQDTNDAIIDMGTLKVTAQRGNTSIKDSAQKVVVIGRQAIEEQLSVSSDTSQALSKLIPGYGPSSEKMGTNGETMRGRTALYMIDGVPQSNPLRDGKREARTIDLSMVDKIEVIYGASAEQGLGATGGIINFITKANRKDDINQQVSVSVNGSQSLQPDSVGGDIRYQFTAGKDKTDVMVALKAGKTGLYYEADNRRMGMSGNDLMNSQNYDLFAKVGYQLTDDAQLTASVNHYKLQGKQDYKNIPGNRATGRTDTSVKTDEVLPSIFNQVTTANITAQHNSFLGSVLSLQGYYQDFAARYRATKAVNFQDPAIKPIGELLDQSQNNSKKLGAKATVNTTGLLDGKLNITAGADYLHDTTQQVLVITQRDWTPKMMLDSKAVFGQANYQALPNLAVNAGVRYELGNIDVKDYYTLAATSRNNKDETLKYKPIFVAGGKITYQKPLVNVGAVYDVSDKTQVFASYAQGLSMPDMGRTLRGISKAGERVDSLKLEPVITGSTELGVRHQGDKMALAVSAFNSKSDFGATMQYDPAIASYKVERQKTDIKGGEASINVQLNPQTTLNASYAHTMGKFEDENGNWVDMGARDIAPNKLSAGVSYKMADKKVASLTAQHYFAKQYPDIIENKNKKGEPTVFESRTDAYTLVDFSYSQPLGQGRIGLGVNNLFNTEYKSFTTQAIAVNADTYNGGRGRNYTLSYKIDF